MKSKQEAAPVPGATRTCHLHVFDALVAAQCLQAEARRNRVAAASIARNSDEAEQLAGVALVCRELAEIYERVAQILLRSE